MHLKLVGCALLTEHKADPQRLRRVHLADLVDDLHARVHRDHDEWELDGLWEFIWEFDLLRLLAVVLNEDHACGARVLHESSLLVCWAARHCLQSMHRGPRSDERSGWLGTYRSKLSTATITYLSVPLVDSGEQASNGNAISTSRNVQLGGLPSAESTP